MILIKKLAITLAAAALLIATGCGDSKTPLLTYVARANSDSVPHLYTLNEATGQSTAVAIPIPDSAYFVAANSDATKVTYCRSVDTTETYEIFVMGTDGVEKQLTTNTDSCESVFSPDGRTIAFISLQTGDFVTYTMNSDGSNQKAFYLPDAGTFEQYYPQFSGDGKSLVFYGWTETASSDARHQHRGVQVPHWSDHKVNPRAKVKSSVVSEDGWYVMHLTDSAPTLAYATDDWWGPAVFTGDGKKLLLTMSGDSEFANVFSVSVDGTGLTQLTTNTDADSFSPVPHKNLIIFNRGNSENSSWDIYSMDQNGGNQALVHSTADTSETLLDAYWD